MQEKDSFAQQIQDLLDSAQEIQDMVDSVGSNPVDWRRRSQKELAYMLKCFLVDIDRHFPKIREVLLHLEEHNLMIVRRQLAKNGDKYQRIITTLDAISRTKFGSSNP